MTQRSTNPEEILFTDRDGGQAQLQDIIDDGLEGGYEDRIPALIDLLATGEPYHRLLACVMLVSWGNEVGFQTLINWAKHPDQVPWKDEPVTYDRIYGADSAFEMLADAVRTSFYTDEAIQSLQIAAIKALFRLYPSHYFGQTLALAILRDPGVMNAVADEIQEAVEASLSTLDKNESIGFDLTYQLANLLMPLARLDDHATATVANRLISDYPENRRMLRELTNALAEGSGPETLATLERLKTEAPALTQEVEQALDRRQRNQKDDKK